MLKKSKNSQVSQKKIVALVLLTAILVAIGALGVVLQNTRNQLNDVSNVKIGQLLVAAVDGQLHPVPEDAQTGDRYFHQVRLRLPASNQMDNQLLYSYSAPVDEFKEELRVASRTAVGAARSKVLGAANLDATIGVVPELQACARGFQISLEPIINSEPLLTFNKVLADGRVVYVYADMGCETNRESMTEYLKQIESY